MSRRRPGVLRIGDRVRFNGVLQTVTGLSGTSVHLATEQGGMSVVALATLLTDAAIEEGQARPGPVLPAVGLTGLPEDARDEALWWEGHVLEVMTGLAAGSPPGARPKPQYDPATRSLAQRERAKAEELAAAGRQGVSVATVRRKRQRYEARGLPGLVDWRVARTRSVRGRSDERVVQALRRAIEEAVDESSRTVGFLRWRTERILEAEHGPGVVTMPARSTFYELFARMSQGRHTTGSARTRRSLANRPDGPFRHVNPVRPGELMQIDSTPLDVLVMLDNGTPGRVELTGMIDVATRTVSAAALRPTTKSVDASLLLARTVTPEPMRPGWADALRMSRSVLPHEHLTAVDERLAHAAARPVIIPETIVCDHGKAFVSHNFRSACRWLGVNFQPGHLDTPTDKPHIERMIESVGTLFCQYVSGYLGSSVERRGRRVDQQPLWSLVELQELLDEWLVAAWQNRPHDGLRDPSAPGRMFTPNEKYASLVQAAGYVPVALSAEDYVELLPATWRVINAYGIKINHRIYDGDELNPLRRQPSGVAERRNLWEVHHDPYDVTRVWLRNHWDGGWITLFWKHLRSAPAPFGELAWNHALGQLRAQGKDPTEAEIATAVSNLLDRAHRGPDIGAAASRSSSSSRRDRRVAARTHAAPSALPTQPPTTATGPNSPVAAAEPEPDEEPLVEVIPLAIFDAHEEAKRWW